MPFIPIGEPIIDVEVRTPPPWMKRSSTSTQAVTSTKTIIDFNTNVVDNGGVDIDYSTGVFVVNTDGSYKIGATIAVNSSAQRLQAACEFYLNGTPTGIFRGTSYIRNSGATWDFWQMEIAPEPFDLVDGDTLSLYIFQVTGTNYTNGGILSCTLVGNKSRIWIEGM